MPQHLIKYWPLALFVLTMLGSGMTYYVSMAAVAAEVQIIQNKIPKLAPTSIMDLRFTITENNADALQKQVDENEERATEQYEKLEGKLDKVIDLLLEQAHEIN